MATEALEAGEVTISPSHVIATEVGVTSIEGGKGIGA